MAQPGGARLSAERRLVDEADEVKWQERRAGASCELADIVPRNGELAISICRQ
jgi:hypothetical protein